MDWCGSRRHPGRRRVVPAEPFGRTPTCVAYFSMEFMLSEALPIYSGGLGQRGGRPAEGRQRPGSAGGWRGSALQSRLLPPGDRCERWRSRRCTPITIRGSCPSFRCGDRTATGCACSSNLPGHSIWLRAWQVQVGRVKLYLLDSNDVANYPAYRGITSELYGGGSVSASHAGARARYRRVAAAAALGIEPEVCHLNEGHAAFAVLERARSFMAVSGLPFDAALAATCAGNLFTTHTAVAAGFDRFAPDLIEQPRRVCPENLASPVTICWPLVGRTQPTRQSTSTWRTWRSAGAPP